MDILTIILSLLGGLGIGDIINKLFDYKIHKSKIKFETIYQKRVEILTELSKKIYKTEKSFKSLMSPLQGGEEMTKLEKGKVAAESANDFLDYLNENRIYLNDCLEEKFELINSEMKDAWATHQAARWDDRKPDTEMWIKAWEKVEKEIPAMNKEVRKEFRKIMSIK